MVDREQRERIAHHESGHVLVAVTLGLRIRYAQIAPEPEVVLDHRLNRRLGLGLDERVQFLVGGYVAERIFAPDDTSLDNSRLDLERARELTDGAGVARAMSRADAILRARWNQVEVIAAALLERGELGGPAIRTKRLCGKRRSGAS